MRLTPLYQGVALERALVIGHLDWTLLLHAALPRGDGHRRPPHRHPPPAPPPPTLTRRRPLPKTTQPLRCAQPSGGPPFRVLLEAVVLESNPVFGIGEVDASHESDVIADDVLRPVRAWHQCAYEQSPGAPDCPASLSQVPGGSRPPDDLRGESVSGCDQTLDCREITSQGRVDRQVHGDGTADPAEVKDGSFYGCCRDCLDHGHVLRRTRALVHDETCVLCPSPPGAGDLEEVTTRSGQRPDRCRGSVGRRGPRAPGPARREQLRFPRTRCAAQPVHESYTSSQRPCSSRCKRSARDAPISSR